MEQSAELAAAAPPPKAVEPKGAGPLLRTGALAIDALLVGIAISLWDFAVWRIAPLQAPKLVPLGILALVTLYYGWAAARNYHTPGQGFAGLTLARVDYAPLTTRRVNVRSFLFMATSGMVIPNLVIMLFDKKRRTIHDWLTKTWVYALPDFDPRRRAITVAAALLLIIFATARLALSISDKLETKGALSLEEIAESADAD